MRLKWFIESVPKEYSSLKEEYEDMIRKGNDSISIFRNPDRSELRDASERHLTLRWILDMEKHDLFVWDGYVILHNQVVKHLSLNLGMHLRGESQFDGMKLSRSIWVPYKIPSSDIGKWGGSLSASIAWVKANRGWLKKYFNEADLDGAYMGGMRFLKYLNEFKVPKEYEKADPKTQYEMGKYNAAIKFIKKKLEKLLDVSIDDFKFYTTDNVPKKIKDRVTRILAFHPPAYFDPSTLSVVIRLGYFPTVEGLIEILGHEIGHGLITHFKSAGKLENIKLRYTSKHKNLIIVDVLDDEENLADMFAHYLGGKILNAKEKIIMDKLLK